MPTLSPHVSPVQPGYLDTLNDELTATQESYLNSPTRRRKKQARQLVIQVEGKIDRVHTQHANRSQVDAPITYLWPTKGTLGLRLEVC